jgi:hypothetical protein
MALVRTTLSAAVTATDKSIVVASATSVAAGRLVRIDQEDMIVSKEYVSGTTVPVLRAVAGTAQVAHVSGAGVVHGIASDWDDPAPQTWTAYPTQRPTLIQSITATSTLTLPPGGSDLRVILNGTSVITLTIPVPTTDMDGCRLTIVANGAAAHVLTFTGGLGAAGSSYDVVTLNGTGTCGFEAIAANAVWVPIVAVPLAGTVTNITGTLS